MCKKGIAPEVIARIALVKNLIIENPGISKKQIMKKLNITEFQAFRSTTELKKVEGFLFQQMECRAHKYYTQEYAIANNIESNIPGPIKGYDYVHMKKKNRLSVRVKATQTMNEMWPAPKRFL